MGSILGPFIDIEPKDNAWDHSEDIISYAIDNIAKDVQSRLKSRLDNGADLNAAVRARTVTVRNEEGRLIIKAEQTTDDRENTTIGDLFGTMSPTPYIENNKMIFRQLHESEIAKKNTDIIKYSIEEAVRLNLGRHVEDGIRKVIAENPELLR